MLGKDGLMHKEQYLEIVQKILEFGHMWNLLVFPLHGYILIKDLEDQHVAQEDILR